MARTTTQYLDLMKHALGKIPDSRHRLIDTLNDAGRALVNAHPWSWRVSPPVMLPIVANQTWVELPEDFGQMRDIYTTASQVFSVRETTLRDINNRRNWDDYDAGIMYITFEGSDRQQTNDAGQPHRRAEIYPAQPTARTDIMLVYHRNWVDLDEDDGDRVPEIPANFERSLVLFARAFAVDIENQVSPYESEALFGPTGEIARLVFEDGGRQVDRGRPVHSVRASGRPRALYPHQRISFS